MYGYQSGYPQVGYQYQSYNPYQLNQPQYGLQQELLNGTVVDSIDVVRGRNCSLDGSATYYPKSDNSEIYVKKLNPTTGAGIIMTYKLVQDDQENEHDDTSAVTEFLSGLQTELSEIKSMISDSTIVKTGGAM